MNPSFKEALEKEMSCANKEEMAAAHYAAKFALSHAAKVSRETTTTFLNESNQEWSLSASETKKRIADAIENLGKEIQ